MLLQFLNNMKGVVGKTYCAIILNAIKGGWEGGIAQ